MCFRPAQISEVQVCPNCGKELRIINGIKQSKCPFCSTELTDADTKTKTDDAVAAPTAPGAPSPSAPKTPGSPQ